MKRNKLLDSYAILVWIQDEPGAQVIEDLLLSARKGQINLVVSEINLGEVYYRCIRRIGKNRAIEIIEQFSLLPIEIVPVDWDLIRKASEIKAEIPIAYADCFTIATALIKEATVITGDPEFAQAGHLVSIDWLNHEINN
jgi:predicted nucleic acid-binding protein